MALPVLISCVAASGCADGPVPEMRYLNPWIREQWAEDEKHGPTFHTRVARLKDLRAQGPRLSPEERDRIASELAAILREERSNTMRMEIIRTLSAYPSPSSFAVVEAALADADPKVRVIACNTMGAWQTPEALAALSNVVGSDSDLDVRIAATRSLQNFNDPAATKALSIALDDNDPALQRVAMQSLRTTTGRDYGNSVPAWREYLAGGDPAPPPPVSIATRVQEWLIW